MADTCARPWRRRPAFDGILQSFQRHLLRHAFPETSVPPVVPCLALEPVAVSPPKPPQAAASSGGQGGTACPGRLAPGSGDPARSRAFRPAGDCPGNHRFLRPFRTAERSAKRRWLAAFSGLSRRGGPGGGVICGGSGCGRMRACET
jgi:hypothetical protein